MNEKKNAQADIVETLGIGQASTKSRKQKRWIMWGLLVLVAAVILILFSNSNHHAETLQFKTQSVSRGDLTVTVSATGNLEPTNQVDVGSELSGIIDSVEVDYNDRVEVDQVLARLDTDKLQANVNKSRAALESARAQVLQVQATLKEARAELQRLRKAYELSGGKVPSRYELDAAEAAVSRAQADEANAKAQVAQAQAILEAGETDLAKALIRSPINGVVLSRNVEPGQTVAASLQAPVLFSLAEDLTKMELHVDVDEADVGIVRQGQEATFTVDAYPEKTFLARIIQVRYGAQDTDGVVTYETVLQVDNSDLLLRPGMTATADITVVKVENAVLVPNAALRFTPPAIDADKSKKRPAGGSMLSKIMPRPHRRKKNSSNQRPDSNAGSKQRVWTVNDGNLMPIAVTTGVSDGIMTEIRTGNIKPGMELVVATMSAE